MQSIKIDVNLKAVRIGSLKRDAKMERAMISGLDDVVVAETVLSDVDGQAGRLVIRGHSLDDLVTNATYERVVALLWDGFFDSLSGVAQLTELLGAARLQAFQHLEAIDEQILDLPLFDVVRALTARIEDGAGLANALLLVAAPAVFTPAIIRLQQGMDPTPPDPTRGHTEDLLRMLRGSPVPAEHTRALDRYLITACDHGLNASTFVARVVASTRAGQTSAVVSAMGALKGPLHGGAPGPVLDMLDEIGSPDRAGSWLEEALARGDRLMGFGHRVYRVRDPRAEALKVAVRRLAQSGQVDPYRLQLAEAVEAAALALLARKKPDRPLQTNTEFYTALLLEAVGLPREAFTCVFACSRVAGWIAHAREQIKTGRLIRPQSRYVGPQPDESTGVSHTTGDANAQSTAPQITLQ
jgi:citrate synthase